MTATVELLNKTIELLNHLGDNTVVERASHYFDRTVYKGPREYHKEIWNLARELQLHLPQIQVEKEIINSAKDYKKCVVEYRKTKSKTSKSLKHSCGEIMFRKLEILGETEIAQRLIKKRTPETLRAIDKNTIEEINQNGQTD